MQTGLRVFDVPADAVRFAVVRNEGKPAMLTGYALVWDTLSDDRGGYKVKLAPDSAAFASPTWALVHHDYRQVLGKSTNGTLRFTSDDVGVKVEIDLPDTSYARDTLANVEAKNVEGMSFSMVEMPWGWGSEGPIAIPGKSKITKEGGTTVITALKYDVDEVTVTPIPAFLGTSISANYEKQYAARFAKPPTFPVRTAQRLALERLRFQSLTLGRVK